MQKNTIQKFERKNKRKHQWMNIEYRLNGFVEIPIFTLICKRRHPEEPPITSCMGSCQKDSQQQKSYQNDDPRAPVYVTLMIFPRTVIYMFLMYI